MRPSLARPHMCYAMRSPTACADRHDAYLPSTRTFHTCEDDDEGEEENDDDHDDDYGDKDKGDDES